MMRSPLEQEHLLSYTVEGSKLFMVRRRWSSEDKIRIVMESLTANISVAELCKVCRIVSTVLPVEVEVHRGGKSALSGTRNNGVSDGIEQLKKLIGELNIANDAFKKRWKGAEDDSTTNNA